MSSGGAVHRGASTSATNSADTARKRSRRGRSKAAAAAPATAKASGDFWGATGKLPPVEEVAISADPSAVARSLGRPPFPGYEAVSEYHLRAVYESSAKLAEVLATAGDLLASEETG